MLPPLVLLTTGLSLVIGLWAASLSVGDHDAGPVLPFFIPISMFLSPISDPLSLIADRWRPMAALNPLCEIMANVI
jgi:ABC-type polysaccharide/polyol phosphate export permease